MLMSFVKCLVYFFFFNDTATTEIYTLSLHDALPIYLAERYTSLRKGAATGVAGGAGMSESVSPGGTYKTLDEQDRKSTRLNSSHANISYAVFCLKKKITSLQPKRAMLVSARASRT